MFASSMLINNNSKTTTTITTIYECAVNKTKRIYLVLCVFCVWATQRVLYGVLSKYGSSSVLRFIGRRQEKGWGEVCGKEMSL